MTTEKIIKLTKSDLHYISKKAGNNWDGDFDGSSLQMSVDESLQNYVRIGVKDEEVLFFHKNSFVKHLKASKTYKQQVCLAETEWADDDGLSEFELFSEFLDFILTDFSAEAFYYTTYINAYDFIRDTLLESNSDNDAKVISDNNMIHRLASYLFEENYDDMDNYCKSLEKRTNVVFIPFGSGGNENFYENLYEYYEYIVSVLRYEIFYYGKSHIINLFDEKLERFH